MTTSSDNNYSAAVTATDQARSPRDTTEQFLALMREDAVIAHDGRLLFAVEALQRIHGLYAESDRLADRGSPRQEARRDIHNTLVAVIDDFADLYGVTD